MSLLEPLGGGEVWRRVVALAHGRCRCTGECGRAHTATGRSCPAGAETVRTVRLYVAPADPMVPVEQAWRLPVEELGAWCGPCLDGVRRRRRPPDRPEPTSDLLALLDVDSLPPAAAPATPSPAGAPGGGLSMPRRRSRSRRGPPG